MNTLILGPVEIPLTTDAHGFTGTAEIGGETVRVHCTITPVGRPAATPAKARLVTT